MQQAARMVEERNEEIRKKNQVADSERAVVMTALQIAFDSLKADTEQPDSEQLAALCKRIDQVL